MVAQSQAALFQPAQRKLVERGVLAQAVDQAVEVGVFDPKLDQAALGRMQVLDHCDAVSVGERQDFTPCTEGCTGPIPYIAHMVTAALAYRLSAATGMHRGDRSYQQDQVEIIAHARAPGCALAVLADGMGGKSGGRKAADQVVMVAKQIYERHSPTRDDPSDLLRQLVQESHLMIKLTAVAAEEEPHSTLAAILIGPDRRCDIVHAGDSRVYHFRGADMVSRTIDHSFVQRLINEGQITEEEANTHPQSNLLTGCLGTHQDAPLTQGQLGQLEVGDSVLACSDGLWHYFTPKELGAIVHTLSPRDASEMLVSKARQRARGGGDNVSLALLRIEALAR